MIGEISHKPWLRGNAQSDDLLFITNHVGDSQFGYEITQGEYNHTKNHDDDAYFINAYERPNPPVIFAYALMENAFPVHASMDISDGLFQDIHKLCDSSKKGVVIYEDKIPLSEKLQKNILYHELHVENYYSKGDDYQLLFSCAKELLPQLQEIANKTYTKITQIGTITACSKRILANKAKKTNLPYKGYTH